MAQRWTLYRLLNDDNERQSIADSGMEGLTFSPEDRDIAGSIAALEVNSVMMADKDGRRVAVVRVAEHSKLRLCFESAPAMDRDAYAAAVQGTWHCQFVDHEQSEEEEDEYGDYDDSGESRREPASETEFAGATLKFFDDNRYKLTANDYSNSDGHWSFDEDNHLALTQSDDCTNGYEGFLWTSFNGRDSVKIGWKLNDDSHDGQDTLILEFGRRD